MLLHRLQKSNWLLRDNGAIITFAHIFQKFRLQRVFICAQKCISFAYIFSVTFARMFLHRFPWAAAGILLYQGTRNKISALLPLFADLHVEMFGNVYKVT